jgi:hypothetical protein
VRLALIGISILLFSAISALAQESLSKVVTEVAQTAQVPEIVVPNHFTGSAHGGPSRFFSACTGKRKVDRRLGIRSVEHKKRDLHHEGESQGIAFDVEFSSLVRYRCAPHRL